METSSVHTLDEVVLDAIRREDCHITVARGRYYEKNLARAINIANVNQRDIHAAIRRLVESGRLKKTEISDDVEDEAAGVTRGRTGLGSVRFEVV